MKKFIKAVGGVMMAAALFAVMPPVAVHAEEDLVITTNIDKSYEIPLTLDANTEEFYVNYNLNPGDIMNAEVVFKNVSSEPIQVRIADVTDQLGTTLSQKLLEVLDLEIEVDGSPVYKGKHDKVTNPLTQWITLNADEAMTMKIRVEFSKYDADNTFQGAEMKVKYAFEARADIPLDAEEAPAPAPAPNAPKDPETIKTGINDIDVPLYRWFILAAGGVLVIGMATSYFANKKKKDE